MCWREHFFVHVSSCLAEVVVVQPGGHVSITVQFLIYVQFIHRYDGAFSFLNETFPVWVQQFSSVLYFPRELVVKTKAGAFQFFAQSFNKFFVLEVFKFSHDGSRSGAVCLDIADPVNGMESDPFVFFSLR